MSPWRTLASGTNAYLWDVWGSGPNDVYVAGTGVVLNSKDGGKSWQVRFQPGAVECLAVWGSGPKDVYVACNKVYRSVDGGVTWQLVNVPLPKDSYIGAIWGSGPNDVYITGNTVDAIFVEHGIMYRSTDSGKTWVDLKFGDREVRGVWGSGPGDVWVVSYREIRRTKDGGKTFDLLYRWLDGEHGPHQFRRIWGSGPSDIYVTALNSPGPVHSSDAGKTWVPSKGGYGVWGSGPDDVYCEEYGSIMWSSDHGLTWMRQWERGAQRVNALWGNGPKDVFAVGSPGLILRKP
jgi:hypothetical protein